MIYIFKGFGEICKLPCTLCKGCCDAFKEACSSCNTFWEPIIANPLGNYVIGTWVAMGFVCAAAIWGISQDLNCSSDLKGNIQLFCIANVVLACIHSGMSYYMQRQIIEKVGKPFAEMTAKEIQQKAGEILLYDVPVCLYSFLATAGYGLNAWALSLGSCGDSQPQSGSAFVYLVWGALAFGYLFCWYCCQCCQGAVPSKGKSGGAVPPATAVGATA
mmetsp:Transcript_74204/g.200685  ORF Transcript_74204/g.200685 Transcript_74204/m.200685 type:complete len:217 (-) Transcript_74204:114-764(-)